MAEGRCCKVVSPPRYEKFSLTAWWPPGG